MADVTVVGQGIFLRGSIRGEGDLEIRGRIEGDVEISGEVTIAEGAWSRPTSLRAASRCAARSRETDRRRGRAPRRRRQRGGRRQGRIHRHLRRRAPARQCADGPGGRGAEGPQREPLPLREAKPALRAPKHARLLRSTGKKWFATSARAASDENALVRRPRWSPR